MGDYFHTRIMIVKLNNVSDMLRVKSKKQASDLGVVLCGNFSGEISPLPTQRFEPTTFRPTKLSLSPPIPRA